MTTGVLRPLHASVLVCVLLLLAAPAQAQFQPRTQDDRPASEQYIVEGAIGIWFPIADITVASSGSGVLSGIAGTTIDAKTDLGLTDQQFPEFHFELKPARRHKLRFQYIPIQYDQTSTLKRDVVFNGQRYQIGLPTASTLDWKAYRVGYEFDFVTASRGFGGVILDFKYTDVAVNLKSQVLTEFAQARAPIPALGGVGRVYVTPNTSITAEITGFKLPENVVKDSGGHYLDLNIYGAFNFNRFVGVQGGFRTLDVGYLVKNDSGSFVLRGLFVSLVARY